MPPNDPPTSVIRTKKQVAAESLQRRRDMAEMSLAICPSLRSTHTVDEVISHVAPPPAKANAAAKPQRHNPGGGPRKAGLSRNVIRQSVMAFVQAHTSNYGERFTELEAMQARLNEEKKALQEQCIDELSQYMRLMLNNLSQDDNDALLGACTPALALVDISPAAFAARLGKPKGR